MDLSITQEARMHRLALILILAATALFSSLSLVMPVRAADATLNGTVTLQGLTPGTAAYQVTLDVRLFQPGSSTQVGTLQATTDVNGNFTVGPIAPGTYD